jgi:SagB-type dehydrogenase family enzyme
MPNPTHSGRDGAIKANPLLRIRFGPPLACDLPLEKVSLTLPDTGYVRLIASLSAPKPREAAVGLATWALGIEADAAAGVIADLTANRILVPGDEADPPSLDGVRHWVRRGWLDALMLHLSSRDIRFQDTFSADPDGYARAAMQEFIARDGVPEIWKRFPDRDAVALPAPGALPDEPLEKVLLRRRSNRPWRYGTIGLETLSTILFHANEETRRLRMSAEESAAERPEVLLNSSFSALETYCVAFSVEGLAPGIYHYDPRDGRLFPIRLGLFRDEFVRMCIGQDRPREAACAFVVTAVWPRFMFRYRHPRAYRTLMINVAELGHKYLLLATAFRLSTFMTPAFDDRAADQFFGFDGYDEGPLYAIAVG